MMNNMIVHLLNTTLQNKWDNSLDLTEDFIKRVGKFSNNLKTILNGGIYSFVRHEYDSFTITIDSEYINPDVNDFKIYSLLTNLYKFNFIMGYNDLNNPQASYWMDCKLSVTIKITSSGSKVLYTFVAGNINDTSHVNTLFVSHIKDIMKLNENIFGTDFQIIKLYMNLVSHSVHRYVSNIFCLYIICMYINNFIILGFVITHYNNR